MRKLILFFILFLPAGSLQAKDFMTVLSGNLDFARDGDTVELFVNPYGIGSFPGTENTYTATVRHHRFSFILSMTENKPVFFFLKSSAWHTNQQVADNFFLEKGDQVVIDDLTSTGSVHFSGIGSEKLNVICRLGAIQKLYPKGTEYPAGGSALTGYGALKDSIAERELWYLNTKRKLISSNAYLLIRASILTNYYDKFYAVGGKFSRIHGSEIDSALKYLKDFGKTPRNIKDTEAKRPDPVLQYSDAFYNNVITRYTFDSCIVKHQKFNVSDCCLYLRENFKGGLRDRLVASLLYRYRYSGPDISAGVNDALNYMSKPELKSVVKKLKTNRIPGSMAYNFDLPDINGVRHSLKDYQGKVVFLDFWFKGCGNCIQVTPYMEKIEQYFEGKPVVFISINVDKNRENWLESLRSGRYTTCYSTNLYTEGQGLKHPISAYYDVNAGPTLILVGKDGKLLPNPSDPRRDIEKLRRQLTEAINVR